LTGHRSPRKTFKQISLICTCHCQQP
jgi:hypothetical protein